MKVVFSSVIVVLAATAPGHSQVINGESTYEDNYIHTPPKDAATNGATTKDSATKDAATDPTKGRMPSAEPAKTQPAPPAPDDSPGAAPY